MIRSGPTIKSLVKKPFRQRGFLQGDISPPVQRQYESFFPGSCKATSLKTAHSPLNTFYGEEQLLRQLLSANASVERLPFNKHESLSYIFFT